MKKNFYPIILLFVLFYFRISGNTTERLPEDLAISSCFVSKPAHNSVSNSAPYLKVTANVVEGARRYTIELNTSPDFSGTSLVQTSSVDYQRTLLFSGLSYSTTYYARVKTDLSSAYSDRITKFITRAEIFPKIIEPVYGDDEQNPVVLKVVVGVIPDAKRYTIALNTSPDFSAPSIILTGQPNQTTFLLKNLKHSTTYYLRAISDISSTYGPVTRFTTRSQIPQKRLWGLTTTGGEHGFGTIFSFSVDSSTFIKHHDYIESSEYPYAYMQGTLTPAPDGGFYGNTECEKGGTCGNGEVFYVSRYGEYKLLSQPFIHAGNLTLASNNQLYVLDDWINYFRGGIIKLPTEETTFELSQVLFRLRSNSQGLNPHHALLELPDGYLYGVAPYGGAFGDGVIYRIRLDGTGFGVIYNFKLKESGGHPEASLIMGSDGFLYGTASSGGDFNYGTLFKIRPDGNYFTKLIDFTSSLGKFPMSAVTERNGVLYGMTSAGGTFDAGTIFKINIDGSGFAKLYDFNGTNGRMPLGAPAVDTNGYLYGMTANGGLSNMGIIFRLRTNGTGFTKLLDFNDHTGGMPDGGLLLMEDLFEPMDANGITSLLVSTADTDRSSVSVFPNPFSHDFRAEISGTPQAVRFVITDLRGEVVSAVNGETNQSLLLGNELKKGIYILTVIKGDKKTSQYRVVKN